MFVLFLMIKVHKVGEMMMINVVCLL